MLAAFLVQCAPIGKPILGHGTSKDTVEQVNKPNSVPAEEETTPFVSGTREFKKLETYEVPQELRGQISNLPEEPKTKLLIHKPSLVINKDKKTMTLKFDAEIPGEVKESLTLDGNYRVTDQMLAADLWPTDKNIASQKRVQAVAACIDESFCKNIAFRVYYAYKGEILEVQVESEKEIVSLLEAHNESDEDESRVDTTPQVAPAPQDENAPQPRQEPPPAEENKEEQTQEEQIQEEEIQKEEPKKYENWSLPEEHYEVDSKTNAVKEYVQPFTTEPVPRIPHDLPPAKIQPKPVQPPKPVEPKAKPAPVAPAKPEVKTGLPMITEPVPRIPYDLPPEKKVIAPPTPPKPEPKKEEPKKVEPKKTLQDLMKEDKPLAVRMQTPLPAPKWDDERSIPGLKNRIFIPSPEENCLTSSTVKCQSQGSTNRGSLKFATEFPLQSYGIMRTAQNRVNNQFLWGNNFFIQAILKASEETSKKYQSRKPIEVNVISRQVGGFTVRGQKSHQNGLDADVFWPGRTSGDVRPPDNAELDRTFDFMKSLVCAERSHIRLFFIDQTIKRRLCLYAKEKFTDQMKNPNSCEVRTLRSMMHEPGHIDHLHIRSACPRYKECAPDDARPSCIHAGCQDVFIYDPRSNIGC